MTRDLACLIILFALNIASLWVIDRRVPRTVAIFGDSITALDWMPEQDRIPYQLERRLRDDFWNVHVINDGRGGDDTKTAMGRLDSVLAQKPDIVVLMLGVNDVFHGIPAEVTQRNLRDMKRWFEVQGATVIVVGVSTKRGPAAEHYRGFDWLDIMPGVSLPDDLHPDAVGVRQMANKLLPVVEGRF
jgi:acyl-CoA thioesterase-1